MKKILYILPAIILFILSCKKEEPTDNNGDNNTDTTSTTPPTNKTYSAQIILTVYDSLSNPYDSVACIVPYHEATSAYTPYYTDSNGELIRSVWYEDQFGGMPDSQYVKLSKDGLVDTIYIPLQGNNSTNYFTYTLQ